MRHGLLRVLAVFALASACTSERRAVPDARAAVLLRDSADSRTSLRWPLPSPDGRYIVSSESVDYAEWRGNVIRVQTGDTLPLLTLREADPGSGYSHRMSWSRDGTALLIHGQRGLPDRRSEPLCLAYLVVEDTLLSAEPCR